MSLFGLWLESLIYDLKAKQEMKDLKNAVQKQVEVENEVEESKESEEPKEETSLTAQIWDEVNKKFEKSEAEEQSVFGKDVFTGPTVPFGSANMDSICLTDVQLESFLDEAVATLKPLKEDTETYRIIISVLLLLADRVDLDACFYEMNGKQSDISEMFNSVYKFFTGSLIFIAVNAYEITEVISYDKLLDIVRYLNTKPLLDGNYAFGLAVQKTKEAYVADQYKQKSNNGEKFISMNEIEAPILFNNSLLSSFDLSTGMVPEPRIDKRLKDYILEKFNKILSPNEGVELILEGMNDPRNPGIGIDTGCATLQIKDKQSGFIYKTLIIDLGTITGTGINVIVNAFDAASNTIHKAYVNLSEEEIIRKIVAYNAPYVLGMTPSNREEYETVMSRIMPIQYYSYFDFSNMNNVYSKMLTKQKQEFQTALCNVVTNIPWINILGIGYGCPRFRFKSYTNPTKFTLISDSEVRVQDRDYMVSPYQNQWGKFYINSFMSDDTKDIIIKLDGSHYDLIINGQEINF